MVAKGPPRGDAKPRGRPKKLKVRPKKLKLKSEDEQMVACNMLAADGASLRDISAATGLGLHVIRARLQSPARRAKSPSKEATPSPKVQKRRKLLKKLHKKRKKSTSQDLAWELAKEGIHVSKRTVARDQRAAGARHLTNEREQKLSDRQVERRLAYCKALLAKYAPDDPFWRSGAVCGEKPSGASNRRQRMSFLPRFTRRL
jgi:transposase